MIPYMSIAILDYDMANLRSVQKAFEHVGAAARIITKPEEIDAADRLVLPGVGAFGDAVVTLRERGLVPALDEAVRVRRVPVLGVCLGMQLLARRSDEGREPGLGWIAADVRRIELPAGSALKVPNIGWLHAQPTRASALFGTLRAEPRYYFDHSFYLVCDDPRGL